MSTDLRTAADARLAAAAARLHMADPRPAYRGRLRALKEQQPEAFDRALRHYEDTVLPQLAGTEDAMGVWINYGATIAGFTAAGRLVSIDATGRAAAFALPVCEGTLVLHVPDDAAAPVLIAAAPATPAPAQQATLDLLVNGRLGLDHADSDY
ncbi:MAG: hypothetical protein ABIS27_00730 [Longimicrobiales bacterium]